jgi:hypothetical protein
MRQKLTIYGVVAVALVLSTLTVKGVARTPADAAARPKPSPSPTASPTWDLDSYPPNPATDNVVLTWNEQLLETIRKNPAGTGPTITARALGVVHTSMYDAWAAYDPVAKRTRTTGVARRPADERTLSNKSKAISFAAYKTLVDLFPYRKPTYDAQMLALGYAIDGSDTSIPATVGTAAAQANIDFRHTDNSNQTHNADNTVSYPYDCSKLPTGATCYSPVNQWNNVTDRWAWQPLCVLTPAGVTAGMPTTPPDGTCEGPYYGVQRPLTPQWRYMRPFALLDALQYKVPGPPKNADGTYSAADVEQEYKDGTNLDDVAKAKAEYWADGPASVFPPGHDMLFAQALSRKRGHSLDTDVKLFFALGNAMLDSSIAAWAQKYIYDFVRPITAIREHYSGQQIISWKGPHQGFGLVPAEQWMPYQALHVVTPPFPEYVSGHSTFSGAGAQVLMAFTGSDAFNARVTIKAGSSAFEPGTTPSVDVTLSWPTFTAAADEAGMSRRYGGIHFYSGDIHGRMLGKMVGSNAFSKAQSYIQGYSGYAS